MRNKTSRFLCLVLILSLVFGNVTLNFPLPSYAGTPDALTTYSYSTLPSASMADVAYGAGVYVAVGYYGAIVVSSDAETWTNVKTKADSSSYTGVTNASTFGFSSVSYGAGVFVATGGDGVILTSTDGLNWTQRTSGVTSNLGDVEFLTFMGTPTFYVGTTGKVLKSTDGITWTSFTPTGFSGTAMATEITVGESGTRLVIGRDNGDIYHTTDGSAWTSIHPSTVVADGTAYSSGNNMLKWVNGKYYISDPSAWVWTSTNLSSFTLMGSPFKQTLASSTSQMFNIMYDGSTYYMFGYQSPYGYGAVYTSSDGTSWSMQTFKNSFVGQSCSYLNGKYFRLGNEGMLVSSDGSNWEFKWGGSFNDVFFDGTDYVAVGKTGGDGSVWKSSDLSTWTQGSADAYIGQLIAGAYGGGKYIAVGEVSGTTTLIATSSNGLNWSKQNNMNDSTSLYDIAYNGGTFVTVGTKSNSGNTPVIRYSTNGGTSWNNATFTAPGITAIASVDYVNNQFIALGYDGSSLSAVAILTSADGVTWVDHAATFPGATDQMLNIAYDGTEYVLMSMDSSTYEIKIRHSTDLINWTTSSATNLTGNYAYSCQLAAYNGKLYMVALDLATYSILSINYSEDHGQTWQNTSALTGDMIPYGVVNVNNRLMVLGDARLLLATPAGPVNATPSVSSGLNTAFTEQTPIAVAPSITINDSDGDSEWDGGSLGAQITANATANDKLYLPTANGGSIWVNTTGNKLMSNTTEIGTASSDQVTGSTALTFTFNSSATNADVQSVARAIWFNNTLDNPSNTTRTITFTATDKNAAAGTGTVSLSVTRVNDAVTGVPTISGTATHGQTLSSNVSAIADADGLGTFNYQWQVSSDGSTGWSNIASATNNSYVLTGNEVDQYVRLKVSFTDGSGNLETVYSTATGQVAVVSAHTVNAAATSLTPTAGASNTITLTVLNSLGNTDTGFNGTVNVSATGMTAAPDGSFGSLKGTATTATNQTVSLTFTNGVATVDLKLNKASAQNINFSVTGVGTPTSNNLTITPNADVLSSLAVTVQPVPGTNSGDVLATQPVVTLKDQFGNVCSSGVSAGASVSVGAKAGTGSYTLGGTTTLTAVSGVVTFTDLTMSLLTVGNAAMTFSSGSSVDSNTFNVPLNAAIALTADTTSNNVDNDIEITFVDNATFRTAITNVSYNGHNLTTNQYSITAGKITLKPSNSDNTFIRTAGTGNVVVTATGFNNSLVAQTLDAGVVASLVVSTQPQPGAASGDALTTQPIVTLKDQYGNTCSSGPSTTETVVASSKSGTGSYSLGGTNSKTTVNGVATFSDLTITLLTAGNAAMTFTSTASVDSSTFNVPQIAGKSLNADITNNNVDNDIEITFADDATFRGAITSISYNGHILTANQYSISAGMITLKPSVADNNYLRTAGTASVVIVASGYNNSTVSQTIQSGEATQVTVSTQPIAGSVSGSAFSTQPVVTLKDQYNNICLTGPSATATVIATAKSGTGTYTLGGTTSINAVSGVGTYTDLTTSVLTAGTGAITFTVGSSVMDSNTFTIPLKAGIVLTPDTTANTVDNDIEVTFVDDPVFRASITSITYGGQVLTANQYTITAGKITLKPSIADNNYLRTVNTANLVINASGYVSSSVSQSLLVGASVKLSVTQNVTAPASNGAVFSQQPKVAITDQYGNVCTSDNSSEVTASKKDSGQWTLEGVKTVTVINGIATFSGLKATNSSAVSGAQLAFDTILLTQALSSTINLPGVPSNNSGSSSTNDTPTQPTTPTVPGAIVIINGKSEEAGKEVLSNENNKSVVTVVVNNSVIEAKIDSAIVANPSGVGNFVEVSVTNTKSDVAKVELTGDIIKKLETNTFDIAVNRDNVSYVIPAKEFSISSVAQTLGVTAQSLQNIKIEVQITSADTTSLTKYDSNVKSNGSEMVFPPTTFEIVAKTSNADGTSSDVKIEKFSNYVERILEIPAGVDPSKITTGIVFNADGTYSHVPTDVYQKDGKWFAKLNSLTNSDYSVIWNPIAVPSVDKHWSKEAVYDMASRLVVMNPETFKPNDAITRADFAEYIVRALGLYREGSKHDNPFKDVKTTDDRALAILIANEYGIITGYTDGTFKPNALISREEAMTMYQKAMAITKLVNENPNKYKNYNDFEQASDWSKSYIQEVVGAGVFSGKTANMLAPKANLTYAEAVQAIKNLLVASKLINE